MSSISTVSSAAQGGAVTLSVVVPTYREAENLALLIPKISAVLRAAAVAHEIIIVDDNSQDGTPEAVDCLRKDGHAVRLITRLEERGLSSAVVRGFQEARGEYLLCMDADLSHPPEALPQMLETVRTPGTDFVIGSRYVSGGTTEEGWGLFRWLNSRVATLLARPFTSAKDPMAGYFALPRAVFARARELSPIGYKIGLELMVKCGCKQVREIPIQFSDRKFGQSKLTFKEQVRYLNHLKRLADYKYGTLSRLVQFCGVGATGMAVDFSFYALLLSILPWPWLSRALASWVAMTWNFFLNRGFTFWDGRDIGALRQYRRFVASCVAGNLASWAIAMGLNYVPLFVGHRFQAAFVGVVVGTGINFLGSLLWVFRREGHAAT